MQPVPRRTAAADTLRYKEVRGLSRGLQVLRALNAMAGGIGGVVELAKATGMHRTTVKRLLETLRLEGLVHHKDEGGLYALTFEVRRLAEGYLGSDWIDRVAGPAMQARLQSLAWPSDLATPDSGFMIVRESTHRHSLLSQHRATIGFRIPMLVSAIGRAWLAFCSDEEREMTLGLLRARRDAWGDLARDRGRVDRLLADTRRRGYGANVGEWLTQGSVTAVAFPILRHGHAIAAINLVFVRDALSPQQIRARYVPLLRELAQQISREVSAEQSAQGARRAPDGRARAAPRQ